MKRSLTKAEILRNKRNIDELFASGRRVSCRGAKLVYRKNDAGLNRILVVAVRGYGNAVDRNRGKRIVRELFRHLKPYLHVGYDCAVILYPRDREVRNYRFQARAAQVISLFSRAGLTNESVETIRMAFPGSDLVV